MCHWSRTRPVLSRKGKRSETSALNAGFAQAMNLRFAIHRKKLSVAKELRRRARHSAARRPLHRIECIEFVIVELRQRANVEISRASVYRRPIVPHARGRYPPRSDRQKPRHNPSDARPALRSTNQVLLHLGPSGGTLPRDTPLRICDGAILLPQADAGSRIFAPASIVSFEITLSEMTKRSSFAKELRTARARGMDVGRASPARVAVARVGAHFARGPALLKTLRCGHRCSHGQERSCQWRCTRSSANKTASMPGSYWGRTDLRPPPWLCIADQ